MSEITILKSSQVVFPDGVRPASLVIENGLIKSIDDYDAHAQAQDFGNFALMAGVIDPHVHFNEPGRTHWEGWESGTKAALAGGVTTVVEMPLNSIPSTVDEDSLNLKLNSMEDKLYCDVGLWGGAVPGNQDQLAALLEGGVLGFKCFLSDPGTEEFSNLDEESLRLAMRKIAELDSVLLVHAEWPSALLEPNPALDSKDYQSWLQTRPVSAERQAVQKVMDIAKETGCRYHIVHVSSAEVLDGLQGDVASCETCAHYLVFSAEEIGRSQTNYKCAPPIRGKEHQDSLWQALDAGKIHMVTSDHSPCPQDLKDDDFLASWGGISGVQMLLTATWTGALARGHDLGQVSRWLSLEPAKLCGLDSQLGSIEAGKTANLIVFDDQFEFECEELHHLHAGSPYENRMWTGQIKACYLRGQRVYSDGKFTEPQGEFTRGVVRDPRVLEKELAKALEDAKLYKARLDATNSLLEEAEELLEFTWEQVESAEEMALGSVDAASRAHELEQEKKKLEEELGKSTDRIRQMQEVADLAEERAYSAEQELFQQEEAFSRRAFDQALELAVRKARRYDRGLAVLVFQRLNDEGEAERLDRVLRDSDLIGQLDESTYGVILEEDLPYHDIGECIERLSERLGQPYASSIYGADATAPQELIKIAKDALDAIVVDTK